MNKFRNVMMWRAPSTFPHNTVRPAKWPYTPGDQYPATGPGGTITPNDITRSLELEMKRGKS